MNIFLRSDMSVMYIEAKQFRHGADKPTANPAVPGNTFRTHPINGGKR